MSEQLTTFVVTDRSGNVVSPEKLTSGAAIDYVVKRMIRRLRPSRKEKLATWQSLKNDGFRVEKRV